jgi:hypothetical protein
LVIGYSVDWGWFGAEDVADCLMDTAGVAVAVVDVVHVVGGVFRAEAMVHPSGEFRVIEIDDPD